SLCGVGGVRATPSRLPAALFSAAAFCSWPNLHALSSLRLPLLHSAGSKHFSFATTGLPLRGTHGRNLALGQDAGGPTGRGAATANFGNHLPTDGGRRHGPGQWPGLEPLSAWHQSAAGPAPGAWNRGAGRAGQRGRGRGHTGPARGARGEAAIGRLRAGRTV